MVERILDGFPLLQRAAYLGQLTNDMNVLDFLMERPNVVPRFNDRILTSQNNFVDFLGDYKSGKSVEDIDDSVHISFVAG